MGEGALSERAEPPPPLPVYNPDSNKQFEWLPNKAKTKTYRTIYQSFCGIRDRMIGVGEFQLWSLHYYH